MKTGRYFIFLYLLFCTIRSFGSPIDTTATVMISSGLDSLSVMLDGRLIGKTPLQPIQVRTGAHELTVRSPLWPSWNMNDYQVSFVALAGQSYRFVPQFETLLTINSVPYGARVYGRGKLLGKTPCQVSVRGVLQLDLELDGHVPAQLTVDGERNQFYSITLVPLKEWVLAKEQRQLRIEKRISRHRTLMLASLGIAAAAGYSTAYFRSKGNREYDRYRQTAIPEKMDKYFNKAVSYDRIASLSYGLFELGFVMAGYFFLTSRR